ncbi:MAG: hypothetical protein ABGY75_06715 [Gemmataceae bacterium]
MTARLRRFRLSFAFLLALVGFDLLIRGTHATWERHSPDGYTERIAGCAERPRDVVFVGGSTVAEGINPAAVGAIPWHGRTLSDSYAVGLSGGTTSDVSAPPTPARPRRRCWCTASPPATSTTAGTSRTGCER